MAAAWMFAVVACRALIELMFWVLLGRGVLALLAGRAASGNSVLWLFDTVLRPPRTLVARVLPRATPHARDLVLGILLVLLWVGLALVKRGLPN